jgi:hypothetical protein
MPRSRPADAHHARSRLRRGDFFVDAFDGGRRSGEHDQTAFSFGLIWDWAGAAGDRQMRDVLAQAAANDSSQRELRGDEILERGTDAFE